jgi:glycerophosphoryl diester phosphodiesterase
MVSEELVELAHEYEVKVYVWTVGDEKEYDKLSELDVDFIVQDIG